MKLLSGFKTFDNLFDNVFSDPFLSNYNNCMKTDIQEVENNYILDMEMPGFSKDNISIELHDGYLTITANKKQKNNTKDIDGNIIRKERYSGSCSRSFYIGDKIKKENIKATYNNGELKISLPKKDIKQVDNSEYIKID